MCQSMIDCLRNGEIHIPRCVLFGLEATVLHFFLTMNGIGPFGNFNTFPVFNICLHFTFHIHLQSPISLDFPP